MFDKQACNADDEKETNFEFTNNAFANFKRLQIIALEESDNVDTESEIKAAVEKLELNGSCWVYALNAVMTFDLHKQETNNGSSQVELPKTSSLIENI